MTPAARWLLLAAALLLFLFFGDVPERTIFWDALFDMGHVPLFGLLAIATLQMIRLRDPRLPPRQAWWRAFGLVLAVGAATELIQFFQPNREPSFGDLARDAVGAGSFLLVAAVWPTITGGVTPLVTRRGRLFAVLVALTSVVAAGVPLMAAVSIMAARAHAMPTLVRFDDSWWERRLIKTGATRLSPADGQAGYHGPLTRVDLQPGTYPGLTIDEPYPDWRGYQRLVFTIVSDLDAPFRLTIRVHDAAHDRRTLDRFNRGLRILPGVNRFSIALEDIRRAPDRRQMDLSQIRGIIIFGYRFTSPVHVFISPLRLE